MRRCSAGFAARPAPLKSVGPRPRSRAVAILPAEDRDRGVRRGRAAGEEGPQGRLHPDHLRHSDHHGGPLGFLCQAGLNVEVVKTAGWAVIRDKTINKEYDAATCWRRCRSQSRWAWAPPAIRFTVPAIENINGQGITLAMAQGPGDPKDWKGNEVRHSVRLFDAQLFAALLPRRARARSRRRRAAPLGPAAEMVANTARDKSTASSRPTTSPVGDL